METFNPFNIEDFYKFVILRFCRSFKCEINPDNVCKFHVVKYFIVTVLYKAACIVNCYVNICFRSFWNQI